MSDLLVRPKRLATFVAAALLPFTLLAGGAPAHAAITPTRIISLSPSATEILFGIGAGSQVLAVDDNSDFPANAPHSTLSSYSPNVEAIAAMHPDLVILQTTATNANAVQAGLKKLGINVYLEVTPDSVTQAYPEYLALGKLTGHPSRAASLVAGMKSQISAILSRSAKSGHISIFHELDPTSFYSATSKTFIGQVYKDFGFLNIADAADTADSGGYPQLTPEYIVQANPNVILLDDGASLASVNARPGWKSISAVSNKHIVVIPLDIADRWGPRLVDLYRFIAASTKSFK
jgi:iron complex transport system substrate-binding protein